VRHLLPTMVAATQLAGCANIHERAFPPGRLSDGDVLRLEREELALVTRNGGRRDMSAIDGVEGLRCVTLDRLGAEHPRCNYSLRYRKLDGRPATKMRRNRFFSRDPDGRWESVIIVTAS
jgi:hypothetical protein